MGWEDYLEEEMTTHSSILAGIILETEEPGGLQSMFFKELDTTEQLSTHACSSTVLANMLDCTTKMQPESFSLLRTSS